LVTRKKLEENISEVKDTMDTIRKNEVATIGRNLHDNVGNILASALGYLNLRNVNNETVQNLVKDAISEIRFLSHNLVKDDNLPIKVKINRLIEHFNEFSNINYVFTDYSNNKINQLSAEQQTNLYFIIQELFTNTLKHSFATEVILQIFEDNKRIWVTIEDDGVGMKNKKIDEGIGLKNIDARAKLAGFKVMTDSSMHGTNTTIELML
jgi:signal transduction histidine kinase